MKNFYNSERSESLRIDNLIEWMQDISRDRINIKEGIISPEYRMYLERERVCTN